MSTKSRLEETYGEILRNWDRGVDPKVTFFSETTKTFYGLSAFTMKSELLFAFKMYEIRGKIHTMFFTRVITPGEEASSIIARFFQWVFEDLAGHTRVDLFKRLGE